MEGLIRGETTLPYVEYLAEQLVMQIPAGAARRDASDHGKSGDAEHQRFLENRC